MSFVRKVCASCAVLIVLVFLFALAACAQSAYITESAKIYKKADTDSKHASISVGTKVELVATKNGWAKVEYNGKTGYVKSKYVSKVVDVDDRTMYLKQSDKLRKSISSSKTVCKLSKGAAVKVTKTCGEWSFVKVNGKKGVVKSSHLTSSVPADDAKTYYVSSRKLTVYSSNSASSKAIDTLKAGDTVKVLSKSGKWACVKSGSGTGYVRTKDITSRKSNVPTYKTTVCAVKKDGTALYASTDGGKAKGYFAKDAVVTVKAYTSSWAYVTTKNESGYVRTSNLKKTTAKKNSSAVPAKGTAETADWFESKIRYAFAKGAKVTVTDVDTRRAFKVRRKGGHNHADVEPVSADDTEVMKSIYGGNWSWNRRAVFVTVNGKNYAASMNGKPHGKYDIKDNNFNGHFCIHFTNSRTHKSNKVDEQHQKMVQKAAKAKL